MIIFEGINKSGKSTIIQAVQRYKNMPRIKVADVSDKKGLFEIQESIESLGVPVNDFYEDLVNVEFAKQSGNTNVILDRSLPSGVVYRQYENNLIPKKPPITMDIIDWWFRTIKEIGALYVWVHCDWSTVESRGLKPGWLETKNQYKQLEDGFSNMWMKAQEYGVNSIVVNNSEYKKLTPDYIANFILENYIINRVGNTHL